MLLDDVSFIRQSPAFWLIVFTVYSGQNSMGILGEPRRCMKTKLSQLPTMESRLNYGISYLGLHCVWKIKFSDN